VFGVAGFFLTRHADLMLTKQVKDVYHQMLATATDSVITVHLLCQVLVNIHTYLVEEEQRMMRAEAECKQ